MPTHSFKLGTFIYVIIENHFKKMCEAMLFLSQTNILQIFLLFETFGHIQFLVKQRFPFSMLLSESETAGIHHKMTHRMSRSTEHQNKKNCVWTRDILKVAHCVSCTVPNSGPPQPFFWQSILPIGIRVLFV